MESRFDEFGDKQNDGTGGKDEDHSSSEQLFSDNPLEFLHEEERAEFLKLLEEGAFFNEAAFNNNQAAMIQNQASPAKKRQITDVGNVDTEDEKKDNKLSKRNAESMINPDYKKENKKLKKELNKYKTENLNLIKEKEKLALLYGDRKRKFLE